LVAPVEEDDDIVIIQVILSNPMAK